MRFGSPEVIAICACLAMTQCRPANSASGASASAVAGAPSAPATTTAKEATARRSAARWVVANPEKPTALCPTFGQTGAGTVFQLDGDARGLVVDGTRFVRRGDRPSPSPVQGPSELEAAWQIPASFGGGYVFASADAVYFSDAFDAPLRKTATRPKDAAIAIGHGVVWIGERAVDWKTGAPRDIAEGSVCLHPKGFSVTERRRGEAFFSRDGKTFSPLGVQAQWPRVVGDSIELSPIGDKAGRVRVDAGGKVTSIPGDPTQLDSALSGVASEGLAEAPELSALPAALVEDARWSRLPRSDSAFALVSGSALFLYDEAAQTLARREIALHQDFQRDGGCAIVAQDEERVVVCAKMDSARLTVRVARLDTSTFALTEERAARAAMATRSGFFAGAPTGHDRVGLIVAGMSCEDSTPTEGRLCVRRLGGAWKTLIDPSAGQLFPYVTRTLFLETKPPLNPHGELTLRDLESGQARVFSVAEHDALLKALGVDPALPALDAMMSAPAFVGSMQSPLDGVRLFMGPNRLAALAPAFKGGKPAGSSAGNLSTSSHVEGLYVVDVPFRGDIKVRHLDGTFALSGRKILRVADGKLSRSLDGGDSWSEAEPPTTGVPRTLEGARCTDNGCQLGAWIRVGW